MRLTRSAARQLALSCQGLGPRWSLPPGKEGAARAIERLEYLQIDTIAVVQRAHHHILWSRCPGYAPAMLHELHSRDRRVFEGWTRVACYLPIEDYRYYLPAMQAFAASEKTRRFLENNSEIVDHVRGRIREEGPLASADFASPEGQRRGPWWDWKPAKRVLEMLFQAGELMISERRSFQRVYDLTERVLPPDTNTAAPNSDEAARFVVNRVLAAGGVAAGGDLRLTWKRSERAEAALDEMVAEGTVTPVEIDQVEGEYFALTSVLQAGNNSAPDHAAVHILSPFDNLVTNRRRVLQLFGFECKLEAYFPAEKRKYGYFCLPILRDDRFVGRVDAKADRRQRILIVRGLMFEADVTDFARLAPPLADRLREFADFNDCGDIVLEAVDPEEARGPLVRELS